ncbi:MAG: glycoside hydrolase family 88 protein [Eubacteriales bacterium]|nr:glycoside hydrolase family 88 protein [Eubacteriales bacterium]
MREELTSAVFLEAAKAGCETLMKKFAPQELPPKGRFHYHQGVFLSGVYETYRLTGEKRYLEYIKAWVDSLIDPYGNITSCNPGQLDDLQPGILLFPLYEATGDKRYKAAMDVIAYYIERFPRNPEGGFWHKLWYHNQMWLDGLYMGGPFMAEYGAKFDRPDYFDLDVKQAEMMREKTRDDATGLWYHAWDYDRQLPWADPVTGRSPEFWGRSMGWVPVALLGEADFMPEGSENRRKLETISCELLSALLPYQDKATGLWYQVTDKGDRPENWTETSCTCLYAAALMKAVRLGLMDEKALSSAKRGAQAVLDGLGKDENGVLLGNVCIGTCVGDYDFYCARPTSVNDLHGMGAFLLMCTEAARTLTK